MERCTICLVQEPVMHWHHSIPRSRGGDDSKQIPLCSGCHNSLHSNAVSIVARVRGSRSTPKEFWTNPDDRERAQPWLEILVRALLDAPVGDRKHLVSCSVSTGLFEEFRLLQVDQGMSSQEETMRYCLEFTIRMKGLKNAYGIEKGIDAHSAMWLMHVHRT